MSKPHAEHPTICTECWTTFQQCIESAPSPGPANAVCWCPHGQVLGIATVNGGRIERTIVQGPLAATEASATLRQLASIVVVAPEGLN